MPRYVIERNFPGAGKTSAADLQAMAAKSNEVLREMGPDIQWLHSYVGGDKVYCVYIAKNPELVREHARRGGFPFDAISEVATVIDPTTGESR